MPGRVGELKLGMGPANFKGLPDGGEDPGGWFIGRFMATGVGLLAKQWSLLGVPH